MSKAVEPEQEFTAEEIAELDKFEAEHPYQEIPSEEIRVPKRPEKVTDTRFDLIFLGLFCIAMGVFLVVILFF